MKKVLQVSRTQTPLGEVVLAFTPRGLALLEFADGLEARQTLEKLARAAALTVAEGEDARSREVAAQLAAYFAGALRTFAVTLDVRGTDFQRRVWQSLMQIPYGETWSYGKQAAFLGDGKAVRAVAGANGRNPVSIIVPCHRVIGSNGRLTGYGGGVARKAALLALEGAEFLP
ncbi:MAG: methylated-DNA--[protein]-cysteine S-methyltransferase [Cardiobacteriaceae bacterium]|nr:methylated-DNA--[protein]-cysteine S-methyltransferase [Cardiobacteriaceae bacterium]